MKAKVFVTGLDSWRDAYDRDPSIIYFLDEDLKFVRCNESWDRFALANGAPEATGERVRGMSILSVIPPALLGFYTEAFRSVQNYQRPWWHIFECSSPEVSRRFQMRVIPGNTSGWLVINTLLLEVPHADEVADRLEEYSDADGIVTMCASCRRAEHLSHPGRWDFIPLLLAAGNALVKPGLCPFCFHSHYPAKHARFGSTWAE